MPVIKTYVLFFLLAIPFMALGQDGKYESLTAALAEPEKVIELQLSELTEKIPENITQLKNLRVVRLINLRSTYDLKDAFIKLSQIPTIEELYLYGNAHRELPGEISLFSNLKVVDLGNELRTALPEVLPKLADLKKLEQLSLRGFELTQLPVEITELTSLRSINLGANPQLDYARAFELLSKLPRLETLNLDFNSFQSFPGSILTLKRLRRLEMSMMYAKFNVPETYEILAKLESLEELDISGNMLGKLPKEAGLLKNLKMLDISGNGIVGKELAKLQEALPNTKILNDPPY